VRDAVDVVLFAAGVVLVMRALNSAVRTTILPRGVTTSLNRRIALTLRVIFRVIVGRSASFERRDRIMAIFGPVDLLALLAAWITEILVAYALIYLAVATHSETRAIEYSGSAIFTLGSLSPPHLFPGILVYTEAGLGLLVLTLLISYLPTIYAAFSRREAAVTLLSVRAGNPASATEMLIRFHRIENPQYRLSELWQNWEAWFVDIEETHTSFPVLAYFRSPEPDHHWVVAAGTLLDAASLWMSTVKHPNDPDAQLCTRAGYLSLRRVASIFSISFDDDPQPTDPITISREEYDEACRVMQEAGIGLVHDREASWRAFAGWRVNYDTVLLNLARLTEAPPAPWVSDRTPLQASQVWSLRNQFTPRAVASSRAKRQS
jgi:hypothetical protein